MNGEPAPWSEEAEIAVLGAMLMDPDARRTAVERLGVEDFHREANRRIFDAFCRLEGRGEVPDVVTLSDELKSGGELDAAGGMSYLAQIVDAVPTAANVEHHVGILQDKATLRRLIDAAREIDQDARGAAGGAASRVLESARERVREVGARSLEAGDALRTAREILEDPAARIRPVTVADLLAWAELVTMLAGREKDGKSTALRWAAARVSAGRRVWAEGSVPEGPSDVLYWGQERPVDVAADLQRMEADLGRIYVRDMRLLGGDRFAALRRDLEAVGPALVIVDTLSTFADPMDLDPGSSADWEPVMNRLGALAQTSGAALALNHHARKSDGEYRDSTAIGAGVDCILELRRDPAEGDRARKVTAKARSAVPARDFSYTLAGTDAEPRLELLDGDLSLEERVQRFVGDHEGCSQRDVRNGVRGREADVVEALRELSEDGGPLVCDDSSTPYRYRIRETPQGTGTEPDRNQNGTAGTDGRGRSGSEAPGAPVGGPGPEPPAGSVEEERQPKRCACGNRIGATATTCGTCKKRRREVREELPDTDDVVQVGETHPHSEIRS